MTRRNQTGLPPELTRAVTQRKGFSYGLTPSVPLEQRPEQPPSSPSVTIDTRGHRFLSSTQIIDTTQNKVIVGSNELRRYLSFYNQGAVTVWLGFGIVPNLLGQNAFPLLAGAYFGFENGVVPNNEIYAIASAACTVTIVEGMI